jgi:mono/diheme cytochrome c family protein
MRYLLLLFLAGLLSCEQQTYQIGERLYKTNCANCHMDHGEGLGALIPPLAGSDYLGKHLNELPCAIRRGLKDTIVVNGKIYSEQMPPNGNLSDIQITNLLNYINSSWGNKQAPYELERVRELLKKCE